MENKKIRISIAMAIYNCDKTLRESIDSILDQTYKNWELILCDDASTDSTYSIAQEYTKKYNNIKLIKNEINLGLPASLNKCIEIACEESEFIARQDGDDISLSQRFEKQISFLDSYPEYALVSTSMICFDENGEWGIMKKKKNPKVTDFAFDSPFCHAPVMMRKKELNNIGNYTVRDNLRRGQDYFLWHKFYKAGYKGYNLDEPLYKMRDDRLATLRRGNFKDRLKGSKIFLEVFNNLNIPLYYYPLILKSLIAGILPIKIYEKIHRKRINISSKRL